MSATDGNDRDDKATQAWLAEVLAGAYELSAEDQWAISNLRPGTAMLVGIGGPVVGARYLLRGSEVRIGRADDCLVWLPAPSVSRHHATLTRSEHGYQLTDEGSLNGSWVNHQLVERALLHEGDEVQFGACRFLYVEGLQESD